MKWTNIIENSIQLILVFVGLGIYTSMVLKPILITAIQTETTSVENNIKTSIDNKFKKIDELTSSLDFTNPIDNKQSLNTTQEDCYISIEEFNSYKVSDKKRINKIKER